MHPYVHCSIVYNSQDTEAILVPIKRKMGKDVVCIYIHTHTQEYYSAIKNEILLFVKTWMKLESIMLSKISQRKKYCMISLICGIRKTKQNEQT